jgi:autotransporter passenger strand-loop-strand repeat protein
VALGLGDALFVLAGGTAVSTQVNSGGQQYVSSGGTESAAVVGLLALETVSSGGLAVGATVSSLGVELVQSGGTASNTNLATGGMLVVLSGGTAIGTTGGGHVVSGSPVAIEGVGYASGVGSATDNQVVQSTTVQFVFSGGTATNTSASNLAFQLVDGGTVTGTVLGYDGVQNVYQGIASDTQVGSYGFQYVFGGSAVGTFVSGGGYQFVHGGVTSGTEIGVDAYEFIYGGSAVSTVLDSQATMYVSRGTTNATRVAAGAVEYLDGGVASATIVSGGAAFQRVGSGSASGTTIEAGGSQFVSGGVAYGAQVGSGGQQTVYLSGEAVGTVVMAGGTATVGGEGQVSGSVIYGLGLETIGIGGKAFGTQSIEGGTLSVLATASVSGAVDFLGGGVLALAAPSVFSATVSGFGAHDTIDLTTLAYTGSGKATLSGDVLSVTNGAVTQAVTINPAGLSGAKFYLESDGAGGTDVTPPCFAAGTRIATDEGEIAVEALRPGDRVRLAGGGSAPVVWLGHRRVAPRRHPCAADVQPVRVAANAFGQGRPVRDLMLSPDHAVFCDGVLIPLRYLLNDATVRQMDVAAVTYWHVELPAHGVLLAEGLPSESFLDTGNRASFVNGGAVVSAFPGFAGDVWARDAAAPLITEGPVRDLVYRRLLAQAFVLGWRTVEAGAGGVTWAAPEPPQNMIYNFLRL